MSDLRLALTDKTLLGLPFAQTGQYRVRDNDLPGFFVLIGTGKKSFMIQADLRPKAGGRTSIRMKVAEAGELNVRDARAKAKGLLAAIAAGDDPRPAKAPPPDDGAAEAEAAAGVPTLGEAWARFRVSHLERKKRSANTLRIYKDHMERLFADWLDRSLLEIGEAPRLLADRHDAISAANGPAIANGAMRSFRAVYNHARKTCRALPAENPAHAIDWNPETRRDTAMGVTDLPAWFEQLAAVANPVRRELHLLTLLSGSRPEALKQVQVSDLDLKNRVMRLTKPKGVEIKAFDVPLSRPMMESIFRLRRIAPIIYPINGRVWLFPSDSPSGHMVEHKEDRAVLSHWGNDLRQTYRTLARRPRSPRSTCTC